MDDVRREERAAKLAKRETKALQRHRDFMISIMSNPSFGTASSSSVFGNALSGMMTYRAPIDHFAVQSIPLNASPPVQQQPSPSLLKFTNTDDPGLHA